MEIASALRDRGLRRTPQRLAVLRALDGGRAKTANEVHELARRDCGELGLSTVYRTLVALTDAGMIDAIGQHEGEATYRLCSDHHHHHLVCTECRRVVEIDECDLSPIEIDIARQTGFAVTGHTLTFHGRCADCTRTSTVSDH